ncbi:MAG: hypothetical protein KAV87_14075 [Desulfobacteraceae bacterium]|nr:hypothetical protein [Desulfobacteraceae bacterium]
MAKNIKQKAAKKFRQLTKEEKKELKEKSLKRVRNILESLDSWRSESLSSSFRF